MNRKEVETWSHAVRFSSLNPLSILVNTGRTSRFGADGLSTPLQASLLSGNQTGLQPRVLQWATPFLENPIMLPYFYSASFYGELLFMAGGIGFPFMGMSLFPFGINVLKF